MPVKDDSSIAVVWFRQDLRILDNLALLEAVSQAKLVIPLFIYDETLTEQISPAQFWWLHHSLSVLQDNLTAYGLRLILRRGKTLSIIRELKKDINFSSFHWYLNYEPEAVVIDNQLKELLDTWQVDAASISDGQVLIPPNKIKNLQGDYYKIFTPYWKESVKHMESRDYYQIPNEQFNTPKYVESDNLDSWGLISKTEQWVNKFAQYWQPGEQGAQQQVKNFIENSLSQYEVSRDFMDQDITSKLSPYLHFGEVSSYYVWAEIKKAAHQQKKLAAPAAAFIRQLWWREFSYYLLYYFPELPTKNFKQKFDKFHWADDRILYHRWCQGRTGYPLVDAGMRQLRQMGFMHNRVRLVVASFLTKNLLLPWQQGKKWFFETLIDADLASNSLNWQWVAGSGPDAAPYYRIFNPMLQSKKFDPTGKYLRTWLPELEKLSNKYIHEPWLADSATLSAADIKLGKDYPYPIVDYKQSRANALAAYREL